ncbi:putative reverse transcriptase domain-containing protein [Tanacetum coccineum]|uniref:Reverse transcriptase domain-containing protein n=1 Tax=Tanacetum coccineum TaxID=301880 RepID=A0ABQ5GZN4_9ASTR
MTITRSGMNPKAIEELINQRVAEVLAAYEANRDAELVVESQSRNRYDDDNGNVGEMETEMVGEREREMVEEMEMETEDAIGMEIPIRMIEVICLSSLMKLMTEVYCPRNEILKLEFELWNLTVKNNNLAAYTQSFQELTMMCTKMVPEEKDRVEKFIRGLPDNIQWNVIAAETTRLQDVIRIANNLMDQKLKSYAMKNAENKRRLDNN